MKKKIVKIVVSVVMLVLSLVCFKYILDLDILPNKYLYIFLGILIFLNVLASTFLFIKGWITKIISIILYIIIGVISALGISGASNILKYLEIGFSNNIESSSYNVHVLKESTFAKINDLDKKVMGHLLVGFNDDNYLSILKEKISFDLKEVTFMNLYESLKENKVDAIVINDAYLDFLEQKDPDFIKNTKIIYTFNVENKTSKDENKVTFLDSFNVYLSGSDSRSGYIGASTLSDVNMIVTINPKTHTVLLTNIPRDYYVTLHGTTVKDKLTHAGIYGIDMSKKTLEDVFDMKIDYKIKIGFNSVIKLVDLVGGIDIESKQAFYSHCGDGGAQRVHVKVGMNHFNGAQALSFARERFAYLDGDNSNDIYYIDHEDVVDEVVFTVVRTFDGDEAQEIYQIVAAN